MPLVTAPLALLLLPVLLGSGHGSNASFHRAAQYAQPVASAMVLASFLVPRGALAGALAVGWLVVAVLIASGARRAVQVHSRSRS